MAPSLSGKPPSGEPPSGEAPSREALYARVGPRLQALVRDLIVYAVLLVLAVLALSIAPTLSLARFFALFCLAGVIVYEPLFIVFTGSTIGQRSLNLRVARATDFGPVSFPRAVLRTLAKGILGTAVFIAAYVTEQHQGLHDLIAGTVVIPRNRRVLEEGAFLPARPPDPTGSMPGALRRVNVMLFYGLLWFVAVVVASDIVDAVLYHLWCNGRRNCLGLRLFGYVTTLFLVVGIGTIGMAGWRGLLFGARRRS